MTDFKKWRAAGFSGEVVPVIPPNAVLSDNSSVSPEMRGKVPGAYDVSSETWHGLTGWASRSFDEDRLSQWSRYPEANVGLRAAKYPGADLDCAEMLVVDFAIDLAFEKLGPAPIRGRAGSARCLLIYRLRDGEIPPRKIRIAFTLPGSDVVHAFELLCAGQQYVIEGVHKSGVPYEYDGSVDLEVVTSAGLSEVTSEKWEAFRTALAELLKSLGATITSVSTAGAGEGERKPIGDESLLAPDMTELARALAAVPCATLDYDAWIGLTHAAKAASGGDEAFFSSAYLPWALSYEGNDEEGVRAKWDSVGSSVIGADWLFGVARSHGFTGGVSEFDAVPQTPEEAEERSLKEQLFERFVFVEDTEGYFDTLDNEAVTKNILCSRMNGLGLWNDAKKNAHWYMQKELGDRARRVKGSTYAPGHPSLLTVDGRMCVNTWRPGDIVPESGDIAPWLKHAEMIIPDRDFREIMFDWMAFVIQHPEKKINWHPVFWGPQGTGKDALFFPVMEYVGDHNVTRPDTEALGGQFTWFLRAKIVNVAEISCLGKASTYNRLKPYLVWSRSIPINIKKVPQFAAPNLTVWIFTSNKEAAIQIEEDDRRLAVWKVPVTREQALTLEAEGYFVRLFNWFLKDRGVEKVSAWLLARDVRSFNYAGRAPATDAKTDMARLGLPESIQCVLGMYEEGVPWLQGDLLVIGELIKRLQVEAPHAFRGEFSDRRVAVALATLGARKLDNQKRLGAAGRKYVWAMRDFDRYARMSEKELAAAYAEQHCDDGRLDGLTVVT